MAEITTDVENLEAYRGTVRETILSKPVDYLPATLPELIKLLRGTLVKVLPEHRDTIEIDWVGEGCNLHITFERPATDDEARRNMARAVARKLDEADAERAIYERLKRKYGP